MRSHDTSDVPRVRWDEFLPQLDWRQGEHVALLGPTGEGKTTLALSLLPRRSHSVVIATKPIDDTLRGLTRAGYVKVDRWPPPGGRNRVLLWPRWRSRLDDPRQRDTIRHALDSLLRVGGWSLLVDDVQHLQRKLKMGDDLQNLWTMARSLNVSVVGATQRPRHAPLEMWSQAGHFFLYATADDDDLRRLSGFGARVDSKVVRRAVERLARHEVLYIGNRTGTVAITKAPPPPRK